MVMVPASGSCHCLTLRIDNMFESPSRTVRPTNGPRPSTIPGHLELGIAGALVSLILSSKELEMLGESN